MFADPVPTQEEITSATNAATTAYRPIIASLAKFVEGIETRQSEQAQKDKVEMEQAMKDEQIANHELIKQVIDKDQELKSKEDLLKQQEAQMREQQEQMAAL